MCDASGVSNSCKSNLLLANVSFKLVQHMEEEQTATRWTSDSEDGVLARFVLCSICGRKFAAKLYENKSEAKLPQRRALPFQRALERKGE